MSTIENKHRSEAEDESVEVAEASRELTWKSKSFMGSMFMGEFDASAVYPFPFQNEEDQKEGDEWCAKIDAWCTENLDGDAIDREEKIPAAVLKSLAELGLFGIKIEKKYGGLGLSQTNYTRVLSTVAKHCGSTAATLSAHQSIGIPQPLKLFGTDEQKQRFLPRIAKGELSAFALTEPEVGSDPANMETNAVLSEDGKHWILNGRKLWCTNGVIADLIVVMARTPDKEVNGRKKKQITAFIVETKWEGVEILHRCMFMGIRAIENGLLGFNDVKVPVENVIAGEGRGLSLALATLNDGRLGIPAITAGSGAAMLDFLVGWAKGRVQWGQSIGQHEAGADKLAFIRGGSHAMDTFAKFTCSMSDRGNVDIRMEAATAKLFATELGWDLVDTGLQLRGGRGFETAASLEARGEHPFPIERAMRDARINRIVEGTTDIMHLFLAREALDPHLQRAMGLLGRGATIGGKLKTLVFGLIPFYATWYPKLWLPFAIGDYSRFDRRLAKHMRLVERRTRKLARALFHKMALNGPKLEKRQLTLARFVELGAELAVMGTVAGRAQTELDRGDKSNLNASLYWLDLATSRVDELFRSVNNNSDKLARTLSKELLDAGSPLEALPEPEFTPLPREYASDITIGDQKTRLGTVRSADTLAS